MNTKFLKEETNKQLDIVRGLPEDIFTWDVYMGLHESISTIQVENGQSDKKSGWREGGF